MPPYSPPPRHATLPLPASSSVKQPSSAPRSRAGNSAAGGSAVDGERSPNDDYAWSTTLRRAPSISLDDQAADDVRAKAAEAVKWLGHKVGFSQSSDRRDSSYELLNSAARARPQARDETPSELFAKMDVAVRLRCLTFYPCLATGAECCASSASQETLRFHSPTTEAGGLPSSIVPHLRETHGLNEFTVAATEHILIKFAKQIYENPLILLLLGSAVVSLLVGNTEDAVSICIAVIIVLTGACWASFVLKATSCN
jgi:hypothetical protein